LFTSDCLTVYELPETFIHSLHKTCRFCSCFL